MRFVEDDSVVRRDGACIVTGSSGTEREIGEKQVMVDDDDLRVLGLTPHPRNEALLEVTARGADARLGRRADEPPRGRLFGHVGELGAIASLGLLRPRADTSEVPIVFSRLAVGEVLGEAAPA